MIGFVDGSHVGDTLAVAVAVVLGSGGVLGLARTYIHHRAQVDLERERSARVRIRASELVRLVAHLPAGGKIVERDQDGHRRVVEVPPAPAPDGTIEQSTRERRTTTARRGRREAP